MIADPNRQPTVAMDRYQIFLSSVEIEAQHLEMLLVRVRPEQIGWADHTALLRVLTGLRQAVEEAVRPTPVEPRSWMEQPD